MSKTFIAVSIIFLCIGVILFGFFIGHFNRFMVFLLSQDRTELYSHVSQQGYEVKIYQVGYRMLTSFSCLVIQINGDDVVELQVASKSDARLYPAQHIYLETDNGQKYRIAFPKFNGQGFDYIEFNADFSECFTSFPQDECEQLSDQVLIRRRT